MGQRDESTNLLAKFGDSLLDTHHIQGLGVTYDGGHETLLGSDGDADVDVIAIDDGIAPARSLDGSVDGRNLLHGQDAGPSESAHEAELDARLLQHLILVQLAEIHQ